MANAQLFLPKVLKAEGGYQNDPSDTGNYNSEGDLVGTNYGISAPVYEAFMGDVISQYAMETMPLQHAVAIYKPQYWDKLKGDNIKTQEVADVLVDHGVNTGVSRASEMVQEILNDSFNKNLVVDGAVGDLTIAAMNSVNQVQLHSVIVNARISYYESLRHLYPQFINGWLNRVQIFALEGERMLLEYGKPASVGFITVATVATILYLLTRNSNNS